MEIILIMIFGFIVACFLMALLPALVIMLIVYIAHIFVAKAFGTLVATALLIILFALIFWTAFKIKPKKADKKDPDDKAKKDPNSEMDLQYSLREKGRLVENEPTEINNNNKN